MTYSQACWWYRIFKRSVASCNNWQEGAVDGTVIVKLRGEIDFQTSPKLRRFLQIRACARTGVLLLDFTEVERIDSSALATVLEYYQHARSFGGRLALTGLNERLQTVFDVVRFNEIFNCQGGFCAILGDGTVPNSLSPTNWIQSFPPTTQQGPKAMAPCEASGAPCH